MHSTGVLSRLSIQVAVGSPLYKLDTSLTVAPVNAEASLGNVPPVVSAPVASPSISVPVPIMGESITTGNISSWSVAAGDFVAVDQVVAVIETDKVRPSTAIILASLTTEHSLIRISICCVGQRRC
jgi:2-oxoglutarate dehydrogenase E2 component (dihydrolipoamide succinyltransferase)